MDFSFTSDQLLIRDTVRQFMETEVRPILREYDRAGKFPAMELRRLGELGCCGMLIPERWGGTATDTISYVAMLEEVARVDASFAVALSVTNSVAAVPIWRHGTDAQREKYLVPLAHGAILGSFCLTEPQAGSDASALQTRAVRHGDHYVLNGTKSWVTNGGAAGVYVVFARTDADPGSGSRGISTFLVEPGFAGFRVSRYEEKMGLHLSRTAELVLEDCRVPAENLLGREGEGLKIAFGSLDGGRIGIAAQSIGIAQGALEASVRYAKQRRTFGQPIAERQAIQWMLADMQTEIEAARALTYRAAFLRDMDSQKNDETGGRKDGDARTAETGPQGRESRGPLGAASARAKLYSSEMANRVCARAVQIHGSMGFSRESDVERFYRDARVLTIYEGTSEMQRTVIARDLLRSPAR
jgi:alkylation response protein AidB-like acyl-CoA dehydrogenase